jgi:hypothetical protein
VARVLWINGCFGVGKSDTADLLCEWLADAHKIDPETRGEALRHEVRSAGQEFADDYSLSSEWRQGVLDEVVGAANERDGLIVVPQTLWRPEHLDEIVGGLRERLGDHRVLHVTLLAPADECRRRIAARAETTGQWALNLLDDASASLHDDRFAIHLDAVELSKEQVVDAIIELLQD